MIAVKQKIEEIKKEINQWKLSNTDIISESEELLPETYFKLRYPDDPEAQCLASTVTVSQDNLLQALSQVVPSISPSDLMKYEELRDRYSAAAQ